MNKTTPRGGILAPSFTHRFRLSLYPYATKSQEYLNLSQQVESVRVNLAKREITIVVRDDCLGLAGAFIGEFARLHSKDHWTLAIGSLDNGCEIVMHAKLFEHVRLLDHDMYFDYSKGEAVKHNLKVSYRDFSIRNEDTFGADVSFAYDLPKGSPPEGETPQEAMTRIYQEAVSIAENRLTSSDI